MPSPVTSPKSGRSTTDAGAAGTAGVVRSSQVLLLVFSASAMIERSYVEESVT